MSRKQPLRFLVAGTLIGALLAPPAWGALVDAYDPLDPEVLVSIKTTSPDRPDAMTLQAEYWVSRPELVLVTFSAENVVRWPSRGIQSPPLEIDGTTLSPRSCHVVHESAERPGGFQVPMTMDEFTRMVKARNVDWVHGATRLRLGAEQRAPLRALWDRLRPMVNDPGFRAHALLREGSPEAINTLLRGGWEPNRPTYVGRHPLSVVAAQGNLDGLNLLLRAGAKLDGADRQGKTALHYAILNGHTELAIDLLDRGASLTHADKDGQTPLHLALSERNALLVQTLLERGASPHVPDLQGLNALHRAVERASAPPDAMPPGFTAFVDPAVQHALALADPGELVETLLRFGADPRLPVATPSRGKGSELAGLNALDLALRRDADAVISLLMTSPLVSANDLPTLWNDLGEPDAAQALTRLQARLQRLSPKRLLGDYVTRAFRERVEQEEEAGARERLLDNLRLALDPRLAALSAETPPLEPGADPALTFGLTEQAFQLRHPLPDEPRERATGRSRLVLVQEAGVWKIDRFEALPAPDVHETVLGDGLKNRLTDPQGIE